MSDYLKRKKTELLQSLSKREVHKLLKNNSNLDTDVLQAIQYHHLADIRTKPKEEPKPVPKDDSKESTQNLLIEIGDKNNGIFVANLNDNFLIHMGDGNIEPHTVFINNKGDDNTKTH